MATQPDTEMNIKDYVWLHLVIRLGRISFLVRPEIKVRCRFFLCEKANENQNFCLTKEERVRVPDTASVVAARTFK